MPDKILPAKSPRELSFVDAVALTGEYGGGGVSKAASHSGQLYV